MNIRVWEDLYGRGLFFFLSSVVCYVYCSRHNENISFFDLEPSMRWMFAARLVTGLLGYGFLALSIAEGQGLSTPVLCLLVSGTVVRFYGALNNPYTQNTKIVHIFLVLLAIIGAGLQYSSHRSVQQGPTVGKGIDYFSDSHQFMYGALSAFFFTISQCLVHELKVAIHYSIDTIYVALAMTLVMPSFVLGDYSAHPGRFMIDRYEMMYYAASGVLFFFFHS